MKEFRTTLIYIYKWYILPIGGLYANYHLLWEPKTTIDHQRGFFWWAPDPTFLALNAQKVAFPSYDAEAHQRGDVSSGTLEVALEKYLGNTLELRSEMPGIRFGIPGCCCHIADLIVHHVTTW